MNNTKLRALEALLVAFVCLGIFVAFNGELLFDTGLIPTFDFSANDLLVQDAKRFSLLHGNYSKIGFFHPGPFFLQLMAVVEWLAVDLLRVIPSPIGAHAFAAAMLHAAAVAVLYLALLELFESRLAAAAAAAATLAICRVMIDPGQAFFVALWMPYLYMAAAMLVLASCIGMVTTGWQWLPVGVLGLCMLGHGHASFVGLAPIMTVSAIAGLYVVHIRHPLNLKLGTLPARVVVATIAILTLFALPIAANTILHYPGEVPKYFKFAANNAAAEGISARVEYLGKFAHLSLLLIPVALMIPSRRFDRRTKAAMIVALATVTPAALFYTLRGLDTLEYLYPLYWATVFIAGAAAIGGLGIVRSFGKPRLQALAASVAGIAAAWSIPAASLSPPVSQTKGKFPSAISGLQAAVPPGSYAWIDVDMSKFQVIFDMATLASLDKRQPRRTFCIVGETWHHMYPPALRCDPAGNPVAFRLHARAKEEAPSASLCFGHTGLVADQPSAAIANQCDKPSGFAFGSGWTPGEVEGRWTLGNDSVLMIDSSDLPQQFEVRLRFRGLLAAAQPVQTFTFHDAKGAEVGKAEVSLASPSGTVKVRLDRAQEANGMVALRVHNSAPKSPAQLGINTDQRALGLFLTDVNVLQ